MKLVEICIIISVFVVCHRCIVATLSGSEDLSRALEELGRRRRWLESGAPPLEYGTINHFTPEVSKRQFQWNPALSKAVLTPLPNQAEDDDKRKKKSPTKRSFFRERQHDQLDRKRKRLESDADYDDTWENSEAELLKSLAQRRFLSSLLSRAQQEQARQTNQVPRFEESLELDHMDEDDVAELIELLKKQLSDSAEAKYYMEGEGSDSNEDDEMDRKKKFLAIKKRLRWHDGVRYALGDDQPSKRQNYDVDDESIEDPWWVHVDPRLLERLENSEEDENERKSKRKQDPWFPAFDLDEKKRYYNPMSTSWAKKKRSSVFRERVLGLGPNPDRKKRLSVLKKRTPEETMERKRIVKKSIPEAAENERKIMDELKTIMADEKTPKVHRREVENDDVSSSEEQLDPKIISELDSENDDDDEESPLADYFGYDRRDTTMKKKRTWDDYIGIDKRSGPIIHEDLTETTLRPDAENMKIATSKPEIKDKQPELDNSTRALVTEEKKMDEINDEDETEEKKLNREKMQRYFNSIAAAMSVKKKRALEMESREEKEEPIEAMDRRLEAIENYMLEEALKLVENNPEANVGDRNELREKVVHRLNAAHSLEKVRQGLAEFDNSLNLIRRDREDEFNDEKKKKAVVKKESIAEALNVMAPDDKRNELNSDEDDGSTCQIFAQIVNLCQDLNKAAGDSRGALVDACSRHIMCYACDYAYKDSPQIPCDLIFMREGHDICGDDVHCRSAAAQMHGILRQRAKVTQRANEAICLSESCVRAYLRRKK